MTHVRRPVGIVVSSLLWSAACAGADLDVDESLAERPVDVDDERDDAAVQADYTDPAAAERAESNQRVDELRAIVDALGLVPLSAPPVVTAELFELGQALAFDKVLSGNRDISCMTCHHPDEASGDSRALPAGTGATGLGATRSGGHIIPRNSPPIFNLHAYQTMFWDSRVEVSGGSLHTPAGAELTAAMERTFTFGVVSAQAMFPVTSREEMRGQVGDNEIADASNLTEVWSRLMDRLGDIPEYVDMFEDAYPGTEFDDMTFAHAANAIAGFEIKAFAATNSPWDRFLAGDDGAMSNAQLSGAIAFFESGCDNCHSGAALSDFEHHDTGLAQFGPGKGDGASGHDDFGRMRVTGDAADKYGFRTPPLRNVELTGPWGHDGQYDDLAKFVAHYDNAGHSLEHYDIEKHVDDEALHDLVENNVAGVLANLDADVAEIGNVNHNKLVDFLEALTDSDSRDLGDLVPATVPSGLPVAD